jgi:hypothetical protein
VRVAREGNGMTGPQHYRQAERFISGDHRDEEGALQIALVHATLALAAATAVSGDNADYEDGRAWREVAAEPR